jgi:hypothetical protein
LEAGERATNLPDGCCEAIFMRRVYHHLSEPPAILTSIVVLFAVCAPQYLAMFRGVVSK